MATWEPYPDGGLIVDCGPFVGDWPPYPPLEIPLDCDEIDLLVCLPPPSGLVADVLNGLYPTMYSQSWRFWNSAHTKTTEGHAYSVSYSGGEVAQPSDNNTARPGMHAYLICYAAGAPTTAPLAIMPAGMTAGATGPARGAVSGGHWSDWQTGIQQTYQVTDIRRTGRFAGYDVSSDMAGAELFDAKASLDQHQIDAAGGSLQGSRPSRYIRADENNEIAIQVGKNSPDAATGSNGHYGDTVELTQNFATFVGTGHENERSYDPAVFTGMVLGVDYYPPAAMIDYEAATSTLAGWLDWSIPIGNGSWRAYKNWHLNRTDPPIPPDTFPPVYPDHFAALPSYTAPTFRIQAFEAELVVDPTDIAGLTWQPYGAGTAVGSFTPVVDHTLSDEQVFGGVPATLTLSDMGPIPILSLVVYSDYQGPLGQPITDMTVASDTATATDVEGNTNAAGAAVICRLPFGGITTESAIIGGVLTPLAPEVVYQNPRWRYWIPGPPPAPILGGRLHTVGGHFRSAGGAQINMMQQSGLGPWLPIEDL